MNAPLSGIRVTDLTQHVAGSSGTQLLGDLGAEVIKIEPPEGEQIRKTSAGARLHEDSYLYLSYNRNKKDIVLDLRTPMGKQAFYDLVKVSDVVSDNYRAGVMKRLGADYETLKKINPKIICCSMSGYGASGPYSHLPTFDIMIQAQTGIASVTGEPDGPPLKCGPAVVDICAGLVLALSVVSAVMLRERTGVGQNIDLSLLDVGLYLTAFHIAQYYMTGEVPKRLGGHHMVTNPYGIYPAKDGYFAIGQCWPRITRILGIEEVADDPRFAERDARLKNRNELDAILASRFKEWGKKELVDVLHAQDISAGVLNNVEEEMNDPQIIHRSMTFDMEHPKGGKFTVAANPLKLADNLPREQYTPPPLLGQHSEEILAKLLGYSKEKIVNLKEEAKAHTEERLEHLEKRR